MQATSAAVLTMRMSHRQGEPSANAKPGRRSRRVSNSISGMRSTISRPSSAPMRPKRWGRLARVAASREVPSSSGQGACQPRISVTQVSAMPGTPMSGITAVGAPSAGTTKNHGRVGLSQNWVSKPLK